MAEQTTTRTGQAVVALRVAGASFEEAAQLLGLPGADVAREHAERELASRLDDVSPEQRQKQRALALARIERLMQSVSSKANNAADPEHIPAVRTMLGLIDRSARLLGLDAPTEVTVYNPSATELDAWVQSMLAVAHTPFQVEEANIIPGVVVRDDEPAA